MLMTRHETMETTEVHYETICKTPAGVGAMAINEDYLVLAYKNTCDAIVNKTEMNAIIDKLFGKKAWSSAVNRIFMKEATQEDLPESD